MAQDPSAIDSTTQPGKCVLKVLSGKFQGKEKTLTGAVTLIGSEVGCDIRLNSSEVELLQCVIVETPHGYLVNNLYDCDRVRVNKEPVSQAILSPGDELAVGPFAFEIVCAAPSQKSAPIEPGSAIESEREGLRIQAAAVAAQQMELMEEEARLKRARAALEEKEFSLGKLLEQRQLRLAQVQRALKARFARFKQEEAVAREQLATREAGCAQQTEDANALKSRLQSLRKRFKARWRMQAKTALETLKAKEKELNKTRELNNQDRKLLTQDKFQFEQETETSLAEIEIDKLSLREAKGKFEEDKLKFQENLEDWENSLASLEQTLTSREGDLKAREKNTSREVEQAEKHLLKLRHEEAGLEKRIQNHRILFPPVEIVEAVEEVTPPQAQQPNLPFPFLDELESFAGKLDDQRLRLIESFELLEKRKLDFENSHKEIIEGLETNGLELIEREELMEARAAAMRMRHAQVDLQEIELKDDRLKLEVHRMEVLSSQAAWETEREILQARLQAKENSFDCLMQKVQSIRHSLMNKLSNQRLENEKSRQRLEEERQLATEALNQYLRLFSQLEEQKQSLGIQELALGRLALESLASSGDPAGQEYKLEKLRRDVENRFRNERKEQLRLRTNMEAALKRLEGEEKRLRLRESSLEMRATDMEQMQVLLDERKEETFIALTRSQENEKEMLARNRSLEGQLNQLKSEIERLYSLLERDKEGPPSQLSIAA